MNNKKRTVVNIEKIGKDTIEVPASEYEAMKAVAAGIAEQNALVLDAIKSMADNIGALKETLAGMNIVVNMPEQQPIVIPAPTVYNEVNVPQQPAPNVIIQEQPDKIQTITFKRNREGFITEAVVK